VVTCEFPGAPMEELFNGVHIHRVTPYTPTDNFVHWVHQLNAAMRDRSEALLREWTSEPLAKTQRRRGAKNDQRPSINDQRQTTADPQSAIRNPRSAILLHAHDWLTHFSAASLKQTFHLPLVATIHATEYGRNDGIHNDIQ